MAVGDTSRSGNITLSRYGFLPLIASTGKVLEGEWLTIIQHPGGGPLGGTQRQPPPDFRRAERMPEPERRPDGRLTEEERRDLRRDIDRANREIYKGRQR